MLPKELSNGICSLNEGEIRLAFSAIMQLDHEGHMTSYRFEKTLIRSVVKGVYVEINSIFDGTASAEILRKYGAGEPHPPGHEGAVRQADPATGTSGADWIWSPPNPRSFWIRMALPLTSSPGTAA